MGKGKKPWIDRKHSTTYRLVYKSQSEESKDAILAPQFVPKKPLDRRELKKNPGLRSLSNSSQKDQAEELDEDDLDEEILNHFADASEVDIEEEFEDDGEDLDQFDDTSDHDENEEEVTESSKREPPSKNQPTTQEGKKRLKYRADDFEYGDLGFPDDGYDYSQHLRKHDDEGVFIAIKGKSTSLEKKFFAPTEQEQVAQTNVDLEDIDPEILEALNQDFDDGDEDAKEFGDLLDDFVEQAGGEDESQNREDDKFKPLKDEVPVSKATKKKIGKKIQLPPAQNYTDASDGTSLNERFAAVADTYNEEDIGDLEGEEIEGTINVNTLTDVFEEFEESQKLVNPFENTRETPLIPMPVSKDAHGKFFEVLASIKERIENRNETEPPVNEEEGNESEDDYELIEVQVKRDLDCESVVSSFTTNTENHPRLIKEPPKGAFKIPISKKTGLPVNVRPPQRTVKKNVEKVSLTKLDSRPDPSLLAGQPQATENLGKRLSKKTEEGILQDDEEEEDVSVSSTVSSIRPPNETAEERKLRKQLTKQARKQNRERKKELKTKYHQENLRLQTITAQQPLQHASITPM